MYMINLLSKILLINVVKHVPKNPNNTITVKNVQPSAWSGQTFDFGIYKNGRCIATEPGVRTNSQVNFLIEPRLYFAVARNVELGPFYKSLEWSTYHSEFDLSKYPNGMIVTLIEKPGGGKYMFTATEMLPG